MGNTYQKERKRRLESNGDHSNSRAIEKRTQPGRERCASKLVREEQKRRHRAGNGLHDSPPKRTAAKTPIKQEKEL